MSCRRQVSAGFAVAGDGLQRAAEEHRVHGCFAKDHSIAIESQPDLGIQPQSTDSPSYKFQELAIMARKNHQRQHSPRHQVTTW